jgi:hypothetical protein
MRQDQALLVLVGNGEIEQGGFLRLRPADPKRLASELDINLVAISGDAVI